jgi:branched-chain amino acid aminotransferase
MAEKVEFLYLDGKIVPYEQATVHMLSPAVRYGASVFEGLRGYWTQEKNQLFVFRLTDHSKRLQQSMKLMRMDRTYSIDELDSGVLEVIRANQLKQDIHIRQIVYVGGSGPVTSTAPIGMFVAALPLGRKYDTDKGITACVSSWARITDNSIPPRIKCAANYQNSRFAHIQAKLDGYDSAIFINQRGKVSEGPGECIFIVREGIPVTPSITSDILESITRKTLILLSKEILGVETQEREVDRTELYVAEEAFFVGSATEICPITMIDKHIIGDGKIGPLTKRLSEIFFNIARGFDSSHEEWRSPVYL